MISQKLERRVLDQADMIEPQAWDLARAIYNRPELAYREVFASRLLADFLSGHGFALSANAGGLKTAFIAERRGPRPRPCLAFLAEMDALEGLGHACGHHLIAASSAAAAVALARALPRLPGSIKVFACPAEELGGGKIKLAAAGVFSGIDAALIVHPDRRTEVYKRSLGVVQIELSFHGRAAHAAAEPEMGVNALDAVLQTFNAVNAMRQQLPDHARVHGIITDGGTVPNIIPERAGAVFLARGLTIAQTREVAARVVNCAKGAARASGARLRSRVRWDQFYAPYTPNRALGRAFSRALERISVTVNQGPEHEGMGSTDVGNVSLHAPVLHPLLAVPGTRAGVHTPGFAEAASGPGGRVMLGRAIRALALTGAAFLRDKKLRDEVAREHKKQVREQRAQGRAQLLRTRQDKPGTEACHEGK